MCICVLWIGLVVLAGGASGAQGNYLNGKMNGYGVMQTNEGYEYYGQWKDDQLHGDVMCTYLFASSKPVVQRLNMGMLVEVRAILILLVHMACHSSMCSMSMWRVAARGPAAFVPMVRHSCLSVTARVPAALMSRGGPSGRPAGHSTRWLTEFARKIPPCLVLTACPSL